MSNSNTHWIALAAIVVSLAVLVPVVVGHPAAGTPIHGDGPTPTTGDHAHHEQSGHDQTHHEQSGHDHAGSGYDHTESGYDHAESGYDHTESGHEYAEPGHDHPRVFENETQVSGDHHHGTTGTGQPTASGQVDRRSGWGGCH